jgi:hypothetical protein
VIDPSDYARQVETYLCQKNRGHLVRVVGPSFDMVRGWAASGVPLKVAFTGIDRCCERHGARGPRRRPVRIEFCEADVLDAFDAWRRAVGVGPALAAPPEPGAGVASGTGAGSGAMAGSGATAEAGAERPARKPALAAHIERAIAKLAHTRGVGPAEGEWHRRLEQTIRDLEALLATAGRARGEARGQIVSRLAEVDAELIAAAEGHIEAGLAGRLRGEAAEELAPFGARMPAGARERAVRSAFLRLVREALGLPTLDYDRS